mmetsp:Transcript_50499/g.152110  ORF Transcript_50499/g.152110 Transcript_50499/m.152110 type:complete len:234 (+) Transcript_50499:669-1370(+)
MPRSRASNSSSWPLLPSSPSTSLWCFPPLPWLLPSFLTSSKAPIAFSSSFPQKKPTPFLLLRSARFRLEVAGPPADFILVDPRANFVAAVPFPAAAAAGAALSLLLLRCRLPATAIVVVEVRCGDAEDLELDFPDAPEAVSAEKRTLEEEKEEEDDVAVDSAAASPPDSLPAFPAPAPLALAPAPPPPARSSSRPNASKSSSTSLAGSQYLPPMALPDLRPSPPPPTFSGRGG